jgi:methyl-accepting chemotaxis protein
MRWTLRNRLLAAFAAVLALTAAVGVAAELSASRMHDRAQLIHDRDVVGLVELGYVLRDVGDLRQQVLMAVVAGDADGEAATAAHLERMRALDADVNRHLDRLGDVWDHPAKLAALDRLRTAYVDWSAVREVGLEQIAEGDLAEARRLALTDGRQLRQRIDERVTDLIELNAQMAQERYDETAAAFARSRTSVVALGLLALLLGVGLALRTASRTAGAVGALASSAEAVAAGDLSARCDVRTGDETEQAADAFNVMAARLEALVIEERERRAALEDAVARYSAMAERIAAGDLTARVDGVSSPELAALSANLNAMADALAALSSRVRGGVERITSSATEILASVSQHTASAREQSTAINETSVTAEQVRASAEDSARRAEDVAQQAEASAAASQEGAEAVAAIIAGMHEIRERVDALGDGILTLTHKTKQIGDITGVVRELADQSNLLAVNAAIEAAKAGEQGRGFAVVAAEVYNLAEQSKRATGQVAEILGEIQAATNAAVLASEEGTKVVESGEDLAARAGEVIGSLSEVVQRAVRAARQIAAAAHQQSVGMDQIALAMKDVGVATEQFVSAAQDSEQAAGKLTTVAGDLDELTAHYTLRSG